MGWTVKIYHKAGGDAVSHHRLVEMLSAYFADWHPTMEYVCWEYTHPLEDTYWKERASIFLRMMKKGHTSWTGCILTWVVELPWRLILKTPLLKHVWASVTFALIA
jgi:hypothetical protein